MIVDLCYVCCSNDDWAFANDVDSKQLYYQTEEFVLQASINRFHHRRYEKPYPNSSNVQTGPNSTAMPGPTTSLAMNQFMSQSVHSPSNNSSFFDSSSTVNQNHGEYGQVQSSGDSAGLASLAAIAEADLFQPVDVNLFSVLSQDIKLTKDFEKNYQVWLEREVFQNQINWDELLSA